MSVHYELHEQHIVRIVIDRPERRNALDLLHFAELAAAWRRFNADPSAWVAIVTGVPGSFCSGADLRDFLPLALQLAAEGRTEYQGIPMSVGTDGVLLTLDIYKPIIAAIDGPCLAGGMDLLGGTDIRLATPRATFGLPEPKRGITAAIVTPLLVHRVGVSAASWLLLSGEGISCQRAHEVGLCHEVVAAADLNAACDHRLASILSGARGALAISKAQLQACNAEVLKHLAQAVAVSAQARETPEAREGLAAFLEKRQPTWQPK